MIAGQNDLNRVSQGSRGELGRGKRELLPWGLNQARSWRETGRELASYFHGCDIKIKTRRRYLDFLLWMPHFFSREKFKFQLKKKNTLLSSHCIWVWAGLRLYFHQRTVWGQGRDIPTVKKRDPASSASSTRWGNITGTKRTDRHKVHAERMWWERHFTSGASFPKPLSPSLVDANQTNPNWGTFYKVRDQYFSRLSRSQKTEGLRNSHTPEEAWPLKTMAYSGWDLGTGKGCEWKN